MKKNLGKHLIATFTYSGMAYGFERRIVWEIDGKLFAKINGRMREVTVEPCTGNGDEFCYKATI